MGAGGGTDCPRRKRITPAALPKPSSFPVAASMSATETHTDRKGRAGNIGDAFVRALAPPRQCGNRQLASRRARVSSGAGVSSALVETPACQRRSESVQDAVRQGNFDEIMISMLRSSIRRPVLGSAILARRTTSASSHGRDERSRGGHRCHRERQQREHPRFGAVCRYPHGEQVHSPFGRIGSNER